MDVTEKEAGGRLDEEGGGRASDKRVPSYNGDKEDLEADVDSGSADKYL